MLDKVLKWGIIELGIALRAISTEIYYPPPAWAISDICAVRPRIKYVGIGSSIWILGSQEPLHRSCVGYFE
jgi:hypothetical protein